ncbi:MAG: PqqD family protein [Patescibacteria group bacterium]|jgi:hypothetical protein
MKYKIKKGLIYEKKGKKITIFDPDKSTIIELNETACYIFEKLKKRIMVNKIITLMVEKYNLTIKKGENDVKNLILKLLKEEVIK